MVNQELLAHIRSELTRGQSRDDVIRELLKAGWVVEDINAALGITDRAPHLRHAPTQTELEFAAPRKSSIPAVVFACVTLLIVGAIAFDYYNFNTSLALQTIDSGWKALINPAPPIEKLATSPSSSIPPAKSSRQESTASAPQEHSTHTTVAKAVTASSPRPVDCSVAKDGPEKKISSVTHTHGGTTETHETWEQKYKITTQPSNGGKSCPALTVTKERTVGDPTKPVVDCVTAPDGSPTKISSTVQSDGSTKEVWEQKYKVTTQPSNGGAACAALNVSTEKVVAAVAKPADCVSLKSSRWAAAVHQAWNTVISFVTRQPLLAEAPCPAKTEPAPTTPTVVGAWEHVANEWDQFTMPYDGVASFKDVHPLAERSEIQATAGQRLSCTHTGVNGPFPKTQPPGGMTGRFVCETHPNGVTIPSATVSVTMMTQMAGMPKVDPTKIPAPNTFGASRQLRVRPAEPGHLGYDTGAFRNGCEFSHFNFDDFIVSPGQPGTAHLHVYCGNVDSNAMSTDESLAEAASTAVGGIANLSSYWAPALLMPDPAQSGFYKPLIPSGWNNYYKTGFTYEPTEKIKPLPNGLKMIAGNSPMNTDPGAVPGGWSWTCNDNPGSAGIPSCPPGGDLVAHGRFPTCWDGVNLDSSNHRSHLSYTGGNGLCPSSHPVPIVELAFNIHYRVPAGADTTTFKLSCDMGAGGLCMHGDARVLWDEAIRDEWMAGCIYPHGSCQSNMNKGRELY